MDFRIDERQADFMRSLRRYLDGLDVTEVVAETRVDGGLVEAGPAGLEFLRTLGAAGWLGVGWPTAYGGQGRSAIEQWLFLEELAYRRLPNGGFSISSVGPTIMRLGTEEQKREYLPGILSGQIHFSVGYTEPNSGSDLASMGTRAVRDGDHYVINGQKLYTTGAQYSSHIFLAVRTGSREDKHRGISTLILPLDTPGITIRPLDTQAGIQTNEVFFENVRAPIASLIGKENDGWAAMIMALDFERNFPYSGLTRDFEELAAWLSVAEADVDPAKRNSAGITDPATRQVLAELAVDIDINRLFSLRCAWMIGRGDVPNAEASINKIWLSEASQRFATTALGLMGEASQLSQDSGASQAAGRAEARYRLSTMFKFGAGTNEVQRNIVAQRSLGLPR